MATPADVEDAVAVDETEAYQRAGVAVRLLWALVFLLGGVLLLASLTLVSVSIITPQFFVDPCHRTELVVPASCVSDSTGTSAAGR